GVLAFQIATLDSNGVPTIAQAPDLVWKFTATGSTATSASTLAYNQSKLLYSFPSDVAAVDTDFDGFIDRLYVGDTGGQMWRISDYYEDTGTSDAYKPKVNPDITKWLGKIIFSANVKPGETGYDTASKGRKIFYRPSVVFENGYIGVYFGTGDRAHPLNTAVTDRMYGIFDRGQRTDLKINETNLEDVTADELQALTGTTATSCTSGSTATNCILDRLGSASNYGWYIRFDTSYGAKTGEKVLAPALVFNKVAYYTTYSPDSTTTTTCVGNLGTSRMWAVNYKTGEAVFDFYAQNNSTLSSVTNERAMNKDQTYVMDYHDRFNKLGVGIPSGLVVTVNSGGEAQILIGCGGGVCGGQAMPGGTIFPVYWMPW
ncbi:MAG: PilC/PilY family type IV pilus protein, partial [Desulfuromonadales bacterium]